MRSLTAIESARIKVLTENSVSATLIEPTQNGLSKSIMDATGPIRIFLRDNLIHDYGRQKQGPENKELVKSYLVKERSLIHSSASLYRPQTKKGDPRIWFKNLTEYASPNDILAIIWHDHFLYVINITSIDIEALISDDFDNPLKDIVTEISGKANVVATELLNKLNEIARIGLIKADLNADTAIGRTLERLLGININSSKKPDYKGIELKSFREKKNNRKNLFAQVPEWNISRFKSSAQILDRFGYKRGEDFKLYCTVSTSSHNSQGLRLKLDASNDQLIEYSLEEMNFAIWTFKTLHSRLLEKHNETFWISAESIRNDGVEYFKYKKVQHTRRPITAQFDILLSQGIITLDHLIKRNISNKVVEKGPLFKIKPKCLNLLFPPSTEYNLG